MSADHVETFLAWLKPHERPLLRYAQRMLGDTSAAEDVVQESVLAALDHFPEFTPGTNFKAWIYQFVTYRVLNANRKHKPVSLQEIPGDLAIEEEWDLPDAEAAFDALLAEPQRYQELFDAPVNRALSQLSEPERACLLLKTIGEFNYREIHELLEIPVGSVMGYLSRARRRMRIFLAEYAVDRGWSRIENQRLREDEDVRSQPPDGGGMS